MAGLKKSKIIVTGGAGFIGSHLVEQLLSLGAEVVVIDIHIDPHSYFIVNKIYRNTKFDILDICDRQAVRDFLQKEKPDYIIHLAAQTLVTTAYENPYETFNTNIMGTVNILEEARGLDGIQGIIVASTDKAYGKTQKTYSEDHPLNGDHPYDVSKSSTDLIARTYFKTYQLPVVVTRFGNVYGEGDVHMDRIIPGICEAVIRNKILEIRSDGKYIRDYLYVNDVVEGYIFLLKNIGKLQGEAFNFSSSDKLSVLELLSKSENLLGRKIPYEVLNNAKNEIPYQHLNDQKVRKLGWKNNYSFDKVFVDILNWYRSVL
ncbi:MAG: GDP-mannose 4,6-dehydratase [Candidatus Levybacteria bacterium]|nr:GDP-mannose 4,6-dehydratase [Candidatus Levybacteria bacterium]